MTQQGQPRFRRIWGYVRLLLLVILTVLLVRELATQDWSNGAPTAVFIALLAFLEAVDRGWIQRLGRGGPSKSR